MRKTFIPKLTALIAVFGLLLAGTALADIVNVVEADGASTKAPGQTGAVKFWLSTQDSDDPLNGCNATGSNPVTVTVASSNAAVVAIDSPGSVSLTGCGEDTAKSIGYTVASDAADGATVTITGTASGGRTGGTFKSGSLLLTVEVPAPSDTTPPVITPNVSGTLGNNGWYTSDVHVSWTVTDLESAVTSTDGCDLVAITADTAGMTLTCTATSAGGTASESVTIKRDATPPQLNLSGGPEDGASYYFGDVPDAPSFDPTDNLSGIDSSSLTGYSTAVGSHTITASAIDKAGNQASASISYTVLPWTLEGFYKPVDYGTNVVNAVKNGATVPLKFRVFKGGEELTSTAAVAGFTAKKVSCTSGLVEDDVEVLSTGKTSLRYDTTEGQFIQNWQTPKSPGSCYSVWVTTQDGSSVPAALFRLR